MENIQFIGRESELQTISAIKKSFFLIIKGRRRIGKTSLLRKSFPDAIYLFIWPNKSIDWILNEISVQYKLPRFTTFSDLIIYLLDKKKTIILDEFQNFYQIDKSIYGELQQIIDERKHSKSFFQIAVAGSSYSLMQKVFNDSSSPLYGRRTHEIHLDHLDFLDLYRNLSYSLEEFIQLWSVFEGIPYYYEFIDKKVCARDLLSSLLITKNAQLRDEGNAILSVEFGNTAKTYITILSAISQGKTKLSEIASMFGNKKGEVMKYLTILRNDFNLIQKHTPILDDYQKSRDGRYMIQDNFLSFWFLFVDKQRGLIEQGRFSEIEEYFEDNFNSFVGKKFEKLCIIFIQKGLFTELTHFLQLGTQWGSDRNKSVYEIDIVGVNTKQKEILLGECKWKQDVNPSELCEELENKSLNFSLKLATYKKTYVLFAKSFSKKITHFNGFKVLCIDLKEIQKRISS